MNRLKYIINTYIASVVLLQYIIYTYIASVVYSTVKPAHVVTSFKQSPVLKGHWFLVLLQKISYELNLF